MFRAVLRVIKHALITGGILLEAKAAVAPVLLEVIKRLPNQVKRLCARENIPCPKSFINLIIPILLAKSM
jgi:hypothetical protein